MKYEVFTNSLKIRFTASKIIPKKIKTMFLASTIITSSFNGFAQQIIGDNCQVPKVLPVPALTCSPNNETITNPEKWFKLKSESKALEIKITQSLTNSAEITAIKLIDGTCQNQMPITATNLVAGDGSLTLRAENLVPGQECFIKVERGNNGGNFEMCVKEITPTPIPVPVSPATLVNISPDLGQGYLVLNTMGLAVSNWQLTIVKHTFNMDTLLNNEVSASRRVTVAERTLLPSGVNYHFIKEEFRKFAYEENFMINIVGFNSSGEAIITENNIQLNPNNGGLDAFLECGGCQQFFPNCAIVCLSNNYAYSIQQYKKLNVNLSAFHVENALPIINASTISQTQNPFYWYTTTANYANLCGSSASLPCSLSQLNQLNVIGPFTSHVSPNQPQFFGPGGGLLVGPVVGILKNRGLWKDKIIMTEPNFAIGNEYCASTSWNIQQAVSLINANGNFVVPGTLAVLDPLFHNAQTDFSFKSGLDIGTDDCLGINPNLTDSTFSSSGLISAFFDELTTCLCNNDLITVGCEIDDLGNGNTPKPWMDVVEEIKIANLNNPTATPITINVNDLFKNNNGNGVGGNGDFNGLDITLTESLYSFGILLKNGNYVAKVAKVTGNLRELITQNDLTTIVVFPSPIVGNKYDVTVNAQATVSINYELRDFMGNTVLTRSFNVHKGQEKTFNINNNNIPKGMLFHRFVFADGSSNTIQTIKN